MDKRNSGRQKFEKWLLSCMTKATISISDAQIIAYSGGYHLSPIYQSISDQNLILLAGTFQEEGYYQGYPTNENGLENDIISYNDIKKFDKSIKAELNHELLELDKIYYLKYDDADKKCQEFCLQNLVEQLEKQGIDFYNQYDFSLKISQGLFNFLKEQFENETEIVLRF
jgi:hypothetical protein